MELCHYRPELDKHAKKAAQIYWHSTRTSELCTCTTITVNCCPNTIARESEAQGDDCDRMAPCCGGNSDEPPA